MAVKLLFTLICDDVRMENTSKLVLIGVYNRIINFAAPSQRQDQPSQPTRLAMPKLCLFRRWEMDSSECTVKTEVVGPDGAKTMSFETRITKATDGGFSQEIVQLVGPIFSPGVHRIITKYEDRVPVQSEEVLEVRAFATTDGANQAAPFTVPTQV